MKAKAGRSAAPVLECRGISKSFVKNGRTVPIIKDLDFSVRSGEIALITGRSGSGKSVLMWLLALLDPPTGGEIILDGERVCLDDPAGMAAARRDRISIIFQDYNLIPSWTALENVMAVFAGTGVGRGEQRRKAADLLNGLGLGDRLDNLPAELSIGQRQRVAIARSVVRPPRLILADEPTGGVDPQTGEEIISLLRERAKENGSALVVATHGCFPPSAADTVYELKEGSVRKKRTRTP